MTAMRFKIDIVHQLASADARTIDDQFKTCIDVFEFFKADVCVDHAAGIDKSLREIIEKSKKRIHISGVLSSCCGIELGRFRRTASYTNSRLCSHRSYCLAADRGVVDPPVRRQVQQ